MIITTLGNTPYANQSEGRIHSCLLNSLSEHHHVEAIVLNHDTHWFHQDQNGQHFFEHIKIHPFLGEKGGLPVFTFEMLKRVQPNVVLTIGDYPETDFVCALKAMYPLLFKWVAIVCSGTKTMDFRHRESLGYADHIITTSNSVKEALVDCPCPVETVYFGADAEFTDLGQRNNDFAVLNCGKNKQESNIPAFLRAVKEIGCKATVHTNLNDPSEVDLVYLAKRIGVEVNFPKRFVSTKEGVEQKSLNDLYNEHHVIVDCSMRSATGLTTLEAMQTGCIPVGVDAGVVGEILKKMPPENRFLVGHETVIGPEHEEYAIASVKELKQTLMMIKERCEMDRDWFIQTSVNARKIADIFSKETFAQRVNGIIESVVQVEHAIVVDSF